MFKTREYIAIDIGVSAIKILVAENRSTPRITYAGRLNITPNNRDPLLVDNQNLVAGMRSVFREKVRPSGKNQMISLSLGSDTIRVHPVEFTPELDSDFETNIKYWAGQIFASQRDDFILQFLDRPESVGSKQGNIRGYIVGAHRQKMQERVDFLERVGIQPTVVDGRPFCLANALRMSGVEDNYGTIAILSMGASNCDLIYMQDGLMVNTVTIPIGGRSYTEAIQSVTEMSFEGAETFKIMACTGQRPVPRECLNAISAVNESLLDLLESAIEQQSVLAGSNKKLRKIYMCGAGAGILGLMAGLHRTFQVPAEMLNPLALNAQKEKSSIMQNFGHQFTSCFGLLMRSISEIEVQSMFID